MSDELPDWVDGLIYHCFWRRCHDDGTEETDEEFRTRIKADVAAMSIGGVTPVEIAECRFDCYTYYAAPGSVAYCDGIGGEAEEGKREWWADPGLGSPMFPDQATGKQLDQLMGLVGMQRDKPDVTLVESDFDLRARIKYVTGHDVPAAGAALDEVALRAGLRRR